MQARQAIYNGLRDILLKVPSLSCLWTCSLTPLRAAPASHLLWGTVLTSPHVFSKVLRLSSPEPPVTPFIMQSSLAF